MRCIVKLALSMVFSPATFLMLACIHLFCLSDYAWSSSDEAELPDILARTYNLTPTRRSRSNKIYIFQTSLHKLPKVGDLLLFKDSGKSAMAFRVLKNYPDQEIVAAKRVKKYKGYRILELDKTYLAIQKESDLSKAGLTEEDKDSLKELEGTLSGRFDDELDSGTTPSPETQTDVVKDQDEFDSDKASSNETNSVIAPPEVVTFEPDKHWLTLGVGFLRTSGAQTLYNTTYFSAGSIRYGYNVGRLLYFRGHRAQDSLTIEGGFYMYKTINFVVLGDAYTVLSTAGMVRYNVFFSESFGIFAYAGVMKPYILSSSQAQDSAIQVLTNILPVFGAGFFFQLGPGWFTRADIGYESIALNLVLRF